MQILAFDTATKRLTAALVENGDILARFDETIGRGHAENLLPVISGLLRQEKMSVDDLDLVAVSVGPGSYTGIRIAIATAKGLVFGRNLPVVGVSTLEALAFPLIKDKAQEEVIVPALDARGGRIFTAAFDRSGRLNDDVQVEAKTFAGTLSPERKTILLGDGAAVLSPYLSFPHDVYSEAVVEAPFVAKLALIRKKNGAPTAQDQLKAFYAAPTQAERLRQEKIQASKSLPDGTSDDISKKGSVETFDL